ncbi:hypothetical protein [Nocardia arthritidis]|uniref:Uncharacterized protein n=1 Tax=Nocardia arthritidis TaxID=228602 RepID=A0A6G9Y6E5_9NOCA|nr:hypothetical protein [Nocardia arthritidis]QIS08657.1 hypothetical protein F5544_03715 [Nocardia arthritidis]
MIGLRCLARAFVCVAALSMAACGASDPAETSTVTEFACADASGPVVAIDPAPEHPFTVRIPRLPGWQPAKWDGTGPGLVIHPDTPKPGGRRSATITVTAPAPFKSDTAVGMVGPSGWKKLSSERIEVCGLPGYRTIGTVPAKDGNGSDYDEYLSVTYISGELQYLISMRTEVAAIDLYFYRADLDRIRNGLQIVR